MCIDAFFKCVDIWKDTRKVYTSLVLLQEIARAHNRDVNPRALLLGKPRAWRDCNHCNEAPKCARSQQLTSEL